MSICTVLFSRVETPSPKFCLIGKCTPESPMALAWLARTGTGHKKACCTLLPKNFSSMAQNWLSGVKNLNTGQHCKMIVVQIRIQIIEGFQHPTPKKMTPKGNTKISHHAWIYLSKSSASSWCHGYGLQNEGWGGGSVSVMHTQFQNRSLIFLGIFNICVCIMCVCMCAYIHFSLSKEFGADYM